MGILTEPSTGTGRWRRRGRAIVRDDPFARPDGGGERETGGGAGGAGGGTGGPGGRPGPGPHQLALLRQFFGDGAAGARARFAHFTIPPGLTRATLLWYVGIARRALADPRKATPAAQVVQRLRLALIVRALRQLP